MAVLDSAAGDYVKPSARVVMEKMFQVLKMIDGNLKVEKWKFCANRQEDIPQQGNSCDCGAFVYAYARCLVSKGKMSAHSRAVTRAALQVGQAGHLPQKRSTLGQMIASMRVKTLQMYEAIKLPAVLVELWQK